MERRLARVGSASSMSASSNGSAEMDAVAGQSVGVVRVLCARTLSASVQRARARSRIDAAVLSDASNTSNASNAPDHPTVEFNTPDTDQPQTGKYRLGPPVVNTLFHDCDSDSDCPCMFIRPERFVAKKKKKRKKKKAVNMRGCQLLRDVKRRQRAARKRQDAFFTSNRTAISPGTRTRRRQLRAALVRGKTWHDRINGRL